MKESAADLPRCIGRRTSARKKWQRDTAWWEADAYGEEPMTAAAPHSIKDDSGYDSFNETNTGDMWDPYPEFACFRVQLPVTRARGD